MFRNLITLLLSVCWHVLASAAKDTEVGSFKSRALPKRVFEAQRESETVKKKKREREKEKRKKKEYLLDEGGAGARGTKVKRKEGKC